MKKNFKTVISAILVALMIFSLEVPSFAAAKDPVVARIYVITYLEGTSWTDHAWVYFENLSNQKLKVGLYTLPPGEGVSVGCYAASRADGYGIYYNVESYCADKFGQSGWLSISKEITKSQLQKATDKILNIRNGWDFIFNCMYFAFQVWNAATGDKLVSLIFPVIGQMQLKSRGATKGPKMFVPQKTRVYRQKGRGDSAYLILVSEKTLDKAI